jgi:peptidylprolyl isomerase
MPRISVGETGEPEVEISEDLAEPTATQFATLIQGAGEQVTQGAYITTNYKAVRWDGSVFESTWPQDTAPFETQVGTGQLPMALDDALVGQTVGSQVVVVAPGTYGYPEEGTLVFVVDILDVWNADA